LTNEKYQRGKRSKDVYLLRKFPPNVRMILKVIQVINDSSFESDSSNKHFIGLPPSGKHDNPRALKVKIQRLRKMLNTV
jgi:hypothetical protein